MEQRPRTPEWMPKEEAGHYLLIRTARVVEIANRILRILPPDAQPGEVVLACVVAAEKMRFPFETR
jgi:hypothetical protein